MVQSKNLTLAFSSESSIEEELKRESTADAITILVGEWISLSLSRLYSSLYIVVVSSGKGALSFFVKVSEFVLQ